MATIRFAPDIVTEAGTTPTNNGGLSNANTYQFRNNGKTLLHVNNGGGVSINVTLVAQNTVKGHAIANQVIAVAAGAEAFIGPLSPDIYNDVNGDAYFTVSGAASLTVAVLAT